MFVADKRTTEEFATNPLQALQQTHNGSPDQTLVEQLSRKRKYPGLRSCQQKIVSRNFFRLGEIMAGLTRSTRKANKVQALRGENKRSYRPQARRNIFLKQAERNPSDRPSTI